MTQALHPSPAQSPFTDSDNPSRNLTKVTQRVEHKVFQDDIPEGPESLRLRLGTLVEAVIPINTR